MELSVKGIKFTEDELLERSVSDFVVGEITKSHIVHVFKGHQCMLLLRAGELLTKDFIEKYQNKNIISLKTLPIASVDAIDKYTNVWMKLKAARSEKEQIKLRDELLLNFLTLNHQNSKNSILIRTLNIRTTLIVRDKSNLQKSNKICIEKKHPYPDPHAHPAHPHSHPRHH